MDAQTVNPLLTAKIVRSYLRHNTVRASELPDLIATVHRSLRELGRRLLSKKCLRLPFRCANPCVTTTWFVWNAGIGGKPYAATLAPDTD